MNLFDQGLLDQPIGLVMALVLGLGFGFWLERAGFGSSRKLTGIFYLRDFAVLKVMFSAMATAALALQLLAALGYVDLGALYVAPTVVGAQLVGGLVFGAGFVMGGWCPGTAAVGVATGKLDGVAFLVGAGAGSLAFAWLQPALAGVLATGALADGSLPGLLGVSGAIGALGLLAIALLSFLGATKVEGWIRRRAA